MPDEDKNFGGSLVLYFRKWWRHVKTIYTLLSSVRGDILRAQFYNGWSFPFTPEGAEQRDLESIHNTAAKIKM